MSYLTSLCLGFLSHGVARDPHWALVRIKDGTLMHSICPRQHAASLTQLVTVLGTTVAMTAVFHDAGSFHAPLAVKIVCREPPGDLPTVQKVHAQRCTLFYNINESKGKSVRPTQPFHCESLWQHFLMMSPAAALDFYNWNKLSIEVNAQLYA